MSNIISGVDQFPTICCRQAAGQQGSFAGCIRRGAVPPTLLSSSKPTSHRIPSTVKLSPAPQARLQHLMVESRPPAKRRRLDDPERATALTGVKARGADWVLEAASGCGNQPRASPAGPPPQPATHCSPPYTLCCPPGLQVFVPRTGIAFGAEKIRRWVQSVPAHGGTVTQDEAAKGITHVVVPELGAHGAGGLWAVPAALRPGGAAAADAHHVAEGWLVGSLQAGRRLAEDEHVPAALRRAEQQQQGVAAPATLQVVAGLSGRDVDMRAWLGERWRLECVGMDEVELVSVEG